MQHEAILPLQLKELKLATFGKHWQDVETKARDSQWNYSAYLSQLCTMELESRQANRLIRRIKESKLPKGQVFRDHLARAQEICDGENSVVVQLPGEASLAGVSPGRGLINITAANTACMHVADDRLRQELEFQADSLKADVRQLMDNVRTARARLEEEYRDLRVCIKSDMLAVATTMVDFMLQVRGVDYRTTHDMAHKAGG